MIKRAVESLGLVLGPKVCSPFQFFFQFAGMSLNGKDVVQTCTTVTRVTLSSNLISTIQLVEVV